MFQTFDVSVDPAKGPARLAKLRSVMAAQGVDAFLVPRADAHQGEYVAPRDDRLAWLTGFTGSAGFCIVTQDAAGVFIDGRYRVQVRDQVADDFTPVHWPETSAESWIARSLTDGAKIAYDPWLHSLREVDRLTSALDKMTIMPVANLIDQIWDDQPDAPMAPFFAQDESLTGESSASKRARLAAELVADTAVLTLPDSIAWLLNMRGADIERNPVPLSFAFLHKTGKVDLFAGPDKAAAVATHLGDDVTLRDIADFADALAALTGTVQLVQSSAPDALRRHITAQIIFADDPCALPKAMKTSVEIAGARAAAKRDGAAVVRFLAWLDAQAPKGTLTEIDVVKKLEGFRRDTKMLRDISFDTICGSGAHGAIVHYRVTQDTNIPLVMDDLLLVDSGGQYVDGTTDITRTIAIGTPTDEHKMCYTRVLQGMIALSCAQFPKGTKGLHLDALARGPLWQAGMDYNHGTGHGIGSYLCVHEGPQGISGKSDVPLQAGMIVSNEPGYYREGSFGIRIENLICVTPAPAGIDARDMLRFETLTYVPFDRRLIDMTLLSHQERDWIDAYHRDTKSLLGPQLDGDATAWLAEACAPLPR